MRAEITTAKVLDILERHYRGAGGLAEAAWPTDPYEFLLWWHCGYPQSDERCAKGWAALTAAVGTSPEAVLRAKPAVLIEALKHGGMVPELRAERLKEIALRVQQELGGDVRGAVVAARMRSGVKGARKVLKSFPNIADPGADRILLFAGIEAVAAVPSNNPAPLVRVMRGRETPNYGRTYRDAQEMIEQGTAPEFAARQRAYLLLKVHGQELCRRVSPRCEACPVQPHCAYAGGAMRGRPEAAKVPGSRR